jgi:hypothetical protein
MKFGLPCNVSLPVVLCVTARFLFANAADESNHKALKASTKRTTGIREDGVAPSVGSSGCGVKKGDQVVKCFGWALDYLKISAEMKGSYRFEDLWFSADSTTIAASMVAQGRYYRRAILDLSRKKVLYPSIDKMPESKDFHYPIISACFDPTRNVWNLLSGYRSFVIESISALTGAVIRSDLNVDSLVLSFDDPKSIIPSMCDSLSQLATK